MEKLYEYISNDTKVKDIFEANWKQTAVAGIIGASMLANPAMAKDMTRDQRTIKQQQVKQTENIVAKVIAGEAAGEGEKGMLAVACVIQNRAKHSDPIDVVTKPKQFSAYDNKALMTRNYKDVKRLADKLANDMGNLKDITGGATHYVAGWLYSKKKDNPNSWISKMEVTKVIGNHVFMKNRSR